MPFRVVICAWMARDDVKSSAAGMPEPPSGNNLLFINVLPFFQRFIIRCLPFLQRFGSDLATFLEYPLKCSCVTCALSGLLSVEAQRRNAAYVGTLSRTHQWVEMQSTNQIP